jgi:hypothetical protein
MSVLRSIVIAAFVATSFAGTAHAQTRDTFSVKIEGAAAERQVIAQNTVWTCEGDTCLARPNHAASVRSCRQFVRATGARVISYGPEGAELSAAEIARCNGETETQQASN